MPWVRLDDTFPDHRKLAELGDFAPLCGWLFVCALAWANRQLTDGRLPKALVPRLATFRNLSLETGGVPNIATFGEEITPELLAELLVRVGFWEDAGDAYQIHDFLQYQPSREATLALRARRSKAGQVGAAARWSTADDKQPRNGKSHSKSHAIAMRSLCPVPVPDPNVRTPRTPRKRGGLRLSVARRQAEELRRKVHGRCPHEPPCATYQACVTAIAVMLQRQAADGLAVLEEAPS